MVEFRPGPAGDKCRGQCRSGGKHALQGEAAAGRPSDAGKVLIGNYMRAPVAWPNVGFVTDDSESRRVFSGISRFPPSFQLALLHYHLASPPSALKTSLFRATQITQLNTLYSYSLNAPFRLLMTDGLVTYRADCVRHVGCKLSSQNSPLPINSHWPPFRYGGNTARLARRSDEALWVRVSVARIAPSLLDLRRGDPTGQITMNNLKVKLIYLPDNLQVDQAINLHAR
ncbi:hypothetical protein PR048_019108 [Dryococelus australis]|uniref:Uncharacterized protein n=1 Tax=Dryococelus australis TaxID=614101 RepID=A0ABQ9H2N3_9NEOP|nr:hypothetical protein PR048_019108 [Dryococelus australis]